MKPGDEKEVVMVPVKAVRVGNPRVRDPRKFELIVQNIGAVGLKRPITVTEGPTDEAGQPTYELVCGQGRLEAFIALGQTEIPALIRTMTKTDSLVASLVENIARRRIRAVDQIRMIQWMQGQGNSVADIARKTGLAEGYLSGIIKLLESGEERVLDAVLQGRLPITIAVPIAGADDEESQRVLLEAYERKEMNQKTLLTFKRLMDQRKSFGRSFTRDSRQRVRTRTSADGLILAYKKETQRQRLLVRKAQIVETRLLSLTAAFKALLADENFSTLLRAEALQTLPKFMVERVRQS
ncbi:MAG: ParB N-terminal domain-containing protein [Opitutus sp.]|nr:ParB N-terminal domain-containing protein [Opitutus sp.]MCS6246049.1 ParB N-terminal domain-containing protein [Opitutus sp.]MCS6273932.1 ParB N-terminal domain-containing protein [Opitutus sp.]MCS6276224.1 ParB N-terminal domain-containing protein [Opitutus sp.]MCS6301318.1 ParB N-terminal domain-containing protein [Opitutus sp.]